MRKSLALVLTSSLLISACASTAGHDKEKMAGEMSAADPIAQAETDLAAAIAAGGQWRVIDKATGSKAVDLSKLMAAAKKKAEAGETEEANRMAAHVSKAATIGLEQAQRYAGATPYYN